ncbi:lysylphosphatidylglycerol synthase domain-containing protein [Catellatospora tritici]|uniref:lysylphosphatidylglycerol synthase domain-containing protein n=1 Tax=Catellatospora tritici TaxID=2851566 RepID=UPI001C2DB370|nr:lysylphosphatidylglycerol synthase domain-containing protein [Catellatospora tritici]MBV1855931.1 flippase-like domain-containing protein [Catellatospora tritici]
MRRGPLAARLWTWGRVLGGVLLLGLLVWQVGTGPFLDGVRRVNPAALLAALCLGAVATVGCAWRWCLVAAGLGVRLPLRHAVAAYYRSLLLNSTLPGGVVGDVHRAVRHGLDISDLRLAVRAVVLERTIGLAVQIAASTLLLLVLPSPVRARMPLIVAAALAAGVALTVAARLLLRGRGARWARAARATGAEIRTALRDRRVRLGIAASSAMIVPAHLLMFLLAARTAGATAPLTLLVPLTQLALLAMALPLNIAGWGPREGVAAWAFAAAGLTAAQGVATATTYGILGLAAVLPGAATLLQVRKGPFLTQSVVKGPLLNSPSVTPSPAEPARR